MSKSTETGMPAGVMRDVDEVRARELQRLGRADHERLAGLALSGGGVRAAMVARGVLDVFSKRNLLGSFAYMSSVSGGGYAAAELVAANGAKFFAQDRMTAPAYSLGGALLAMVFDLVIRVPYLFAIPMLVVMGLLALSLRLPGSGVVEWIPEYGGYAALVAVAAGVAISMLVGSFLRHMQHWKAGFDGSRQWPRLAALSLLVIAALGAVYKMFESMSRLPIGNVAFAMGSGAALLIAAMCWWSFRMRAGWDGHEPLFTYYRFHLTTCFLGSDQPLAWLGTGATPFPIFNVTANDGARRFQFELTPLSAGSDATGYINTARLPRRLTLGDAMTASAAALDFVHHDWDVRAILSLFSAGTGAWLPFRDCALSRMERVWLNCRLIANWPSPDYLRISDGGFTDNLGLLALLKRRVGMIVCVDAAHDPEFRFDDLRKICKAAALEGIAEIDARAVLQFGHDLRFAQARDRFVTLPIAYPETGQAGALVLLKLADRKESASKQTYREFPQITTNDQQLTQGQLDDLYRIGQAIAEECHAEVADLLFSASCPDRACSLYAR